MKVPNSNKKQDLSKMTIPRSKSVFSHDLNLLNDHYTSPHDISVSICKEVDKSKFKNRKLDRNQSSNKIDVDQDISEITNINESVHQHIDKPKNRFINEDSIKLEDRRPSVQNPVQKRSGKKDASCSPAFETPLRNMHSSVPVYNPQEMSVTNQQMVGMVHQMGQHQSQQFQMMLQCHSQLMGKLIDKCCGNY